MIAVLSSETERAAVAEFFEIFKTPWEPYSPDRQADVLICSVDEVPVTPARLIIVYGGARRLIDRRIGCDAQGPPRATGMVYYRDRRIPVYGSLLTFGPATEASLRDERSGQPVAVEAEIGGQRLVRIGFDLFQEVRHLLTSGQPPAHAAIPTLEWHAAIVRDLIAESSIPLLEIPPVPVGYNFVACLTHDVDHVGIRNHVCDHTMFGFLHRATVGSILNFCRGRLSAGQALSNGTAALSLPLIHLGLIRDFWYTFDRYLELEDGRKSTFFFLPRKGDPGEGVTRARSARRAGHYEVAELGPHLRRLKAAHCEVGVHGIDAWRDSVQGRRELERISEIAGTAGASEMGVRMHWLCFDEGSPAALEAAGFSYDSTVGFNETVGYRAGTAQVYKPLTAHRLLELPMHIMDTALFYPSYLNLSPRQPSTQVEALLDYAATCGGVVTINWHDRSIAPERLWDRFYITLLDDLAKRGAWFATAAQTVAWFRKRRSASIESTVGHESLHASVAFDSTDPTLPGLRLRLHQPLPRSPDGTGTNGTFTEQSLTHSDQVRFPL